VQALLLCSLLIFTRSAAADWAIECIDCTPWLEEWYPRRCLWAGTGDQALLVTGGDGLYVHRRQGDTWTLETVLEEPTRDLCLAATSADRFWISYLSVREGELRLAECEAGTWRFHEQPFASTPGREVWIEAGSDGELRLAMRADPDDMTLYGRLQAGEWRIETADATPGSGHFPAMALAPGPEASPHLVHWRRDVDLRHSYLAGVEWRTEVLLAPLAAGVGVYPALGFDGDGVPHVGVLVDGAEATPGAARGRSTTRVLHFTRPGSAWLVETVHEFAEGYRVLRGSLGFALDSQGRPYLAYSERQEGRIHLARQEPGGWVIETVDQVGAGARHVNLALDPGDHPWLAYLDPEEHGLRVAHRSAEGWRIEVLLTGRTYRQANLWLDSRDRPHVVSYRAPGERLTYGFRDETGWQLEVILDSVPRGEPAVLTDAEDTPYLAFGLEGDPPLVCVAAKPESAWLVETIEQATAEVFELVLDGARRIHMSYLVPPRQLHHAWRDQGGASWQVAEITTSAFYWDQDLAISRSGELFVAFLDDETLLPRLLRNPGLGWVVEPVDPTPIPGGEVALGSREEDLLVAYLSGDNGALRARRRDAGIWSAPEQVLPGEAMRAYLDAAVDPGGSSQLAFVRYSDGYPLSADVVFGRRDPALGWSFETVERSTVAAHLRLRLDSRGDPWLLYLDGRGDLKLAHRLPATPYPTATAPPPTPTVPPSPTPTPTPTPSPSPAPSASPSVRPTPAASATAPPPTASPSATPSASPPPSPTSAAPAILLGGWARTRLQADQPGEITLAALVEGEDLDRVVLTGLRNDGGTWLAEDLDAALERYPGPLPGFPEEIGLYLLTVEDVRLPAGRYLPCGIRARNRAGEASEVWPFLETWPRTSRRSATAALLRRLPALAELLSAEHAARTGDNERVEILLAGWLRTRWQEQGPLEVQLLALTSGPGVAIWLVDPENLRRLTTLPYIEGTGCYLLTAEIPDPASVPPGRHLVGLLTVTAEGETSHLWPYLEVDEP
jgi:hypothetical protein